MKIRLSRAKIRVTDFAPRTKGNWDPQEALELLSRLSLCLGKAGIAHWITYGSLLGLVRQNSLLAWDNDVDIAVTPGVSFEAIRTALLADGLRPQRFQEMDKQPASVKVCANGISVDIYMLSEQRGILVDFEGNSGFVLTMSHPKVTVSETIFGNKKFPVPAETEAYLAHLYGPHWRIPARNWSWKHSSANRQALDITSFLGLFKFTKSWLLWRWRGYLTQRQNPV